MKKELPCWHGPKYCTMVDRRQNLTFYLISYHYAVVSCKKTEKRKMELFRFFYFLQNVIYLKALHEWLTTAMKETTQNKSWGQYPVSVSIGFSVNLETPCRPGLSCFALTCGDRASITDLTSSFLPDWTASCSFTVSIWPLAAPQCAGLESWNKTSILVIFTTHVEQNTTWMFWLWRSKSSFQ